MRHGVLPLGHPDAERVTKLEKAALITRLIEPTAEELTYSLSLCRFMEHIFLALSHSIAPHKSNISPHSSLFPLNTVTPAQASEGKSKF